MNKTKWYICENCKNNCKNNCNGTSCKNFNSIDKWNTIYYCDDCKTFVFPEGLRTHEVSCPICGFVFGCDD